jgi:S-adenosylmethionine decarboxylase
VANATAFAGDEKAYGAPVLEHFAEHLPEAAGYSLVQLIETSAITGHFCDLSSEAYIDIFSCKGFQAELAVEVIRAAFRPQHINFITLLRQAVKPQSQLHARRRIRACRGLR